MQQTIEQAFDILDRARAEHQPAHYVALFSGGLDSLVNTHITKLWADARCLPLLIAHINTGIGIAETRQYVRATAVALGWRYQEYTTPPQTYIDLVTGKHEPSVPGGFPGAPLHFYYYCRLKDRRIADLLRDLKQHRSERVLLSTGLRQQESKKRMGYTEPITKESARIWVNPLFFAGKDELLDIRDMAQLPRNEVSDCLHRSGECLCGAMNDPGELAELRFWYPHSAAYIDYISDLTIAAGYPWGWDAPGCVRSAVRAGQQFLDGFAPLCSSCEAR